jgi:hypothetical protein
MVDPDAPTPQNTDNAPVRHFLGGDFTFKDDGASLVNGTIPLQSRNINHRVLLEDRNPTGKYEDTLSCIVI